MLLRRTVLLAALLLAPHLAQARPGGSWQSLSFFAARDDVSSVVALSPYSLSRIPLVKSLSAEIALGLSFVLLSNAAGTTGGTGLGNPYLGLSWDGPLGTLDLTFGGGVTIPLAPPAQATLFRFSEGMRGRWDPWLWAPGRLGLIAKARVQQARPGGLLLSGEAGLGWMPWLAAGARAADVQAQVAGEAGYLAAEWFSFGLRAALVAGPPLGAADQVQLSAEPFVRLHAEGRVYEARLTMPLDPPYGFAFGPGGVWGISVGGGIPF